MFATFICPAAGQGNISVLIFFFCLTSFRPPFQPDFLWQTAKGPKGATDRGDVRIGVRAGGARGAAAPPNFGQLKFFGQREKIWESQFPCLFDLIILKT